MDLFELKFRHIKFLRILIVVIMVELVDGKLICIPFSDFKCLVC